MKEPRKVYSLDDMGKYSLSEIRDFWRILHDKVNITVAPSKEYDELYTSFVLVDNRLKYLLGGIPVHHRNTPYNPVIESKFPTFPNLDWLRWVLIAFAILASVHGCIKLKAHLDAYPKTNAGNASINEIEIIQPTISKRDIVIESIRKDIGIKERTGKNDHPRIAEYLRYVGINQPAPYCAATTSFHLGTNGVQNPMSAWSPAWNTKASRTSKPKFADTFTTYNKRKGRIDHVGFFDTDLGKQFKSSEGNYSNQIKHVVRYKDQVHSFNSWINE